MGSKVHLVDLLDQATVNAPSPDYVAVERVTIERDPQTTLFTHPPSEVIFPRIRLLEGATLQFSIGVKPTAWNRIRSGVNFQIEIHQNFGRRIQLFNTSLDPANRQENRGFIKYDLDLSALVNKSVSLVFRTEIADRGDPSYAWSFWADPILQHAELTKRRRSKKSPEELIFLITADALRADHLGCYGHPEIQTPDIDRLAADGWLFEHARTQSPATNAAYASLITGRYPTEHSILTEWGRLAENFMTLPEALKEAGYTTIFAPSEAELADPNLGFTQRFAHTIPPVGRPMQDGAITLRRLFRSLERNPPSRGFIWLQCFDTHPPSAVPEPFRSMYYQGDPVDPARSHRPDLIAEIRGMESVLDIRRALPHLEAGIADTALGLRLRDTGASLQGQNISPPDLAPHITAFSEEARLGKSKQAFGRQLESWGEQLIGGSTPDELIPWLMQILPRLEIVEAEILGWLESVVDYEYALRQYWAQVSYFDHLIGDLTSYLHEQDLYDRSTIILTSPHGELLGKQGVHFHHHTLQEGSLRVPLILKPNRTAQQEVPLAGPGKRIKGVIDQIDILPTLLELAGISRPAGLPGQSRLEEIQISQIHDHDSFTLGNLGLSASLTRQNHKLIWAFEDLWNSSAWQFEAEERRLIDLSVADPDSQDVTHKERELAQDLNHRLAHWAVEYGLIDRE